MRSTSFIRRRRETPAVEPREFNRGTSRERQFSWYLVERRTTRRARWTEGGCRANLKSIVDWNASTLILKVTRYPAEMMSRLL